MKYFWPEAKGRIHVDVWREVTIFDNLSIEIIAKKAAEDNPISDNLFFINLGGYKENEFEEYHYKVLAVGATLADASKKAKATTFYKHCGFKGATSHIDDKFGIDIDDAFKVEEILAKTFTERFDIQISETDTTNEDRLHIGYLKIAKL